MGSLRRAELAGVSGHPAAEAVGVVPVGGDTGLQALPRESPPACPRSERAQCERHRAVPARLLQPAPRRARNACPRKGIGHAIRADRQNRRARRPSHPAPLERRLPRRMLGLQFRLASPAIVFIPEIHSDRSCHQLLRHRAHGSLRSHRMQELFGHGAVGGGICDARPASRTAERRILVFLQPAARQRHGVQRFFARQPLAELLLPLHARRALQGGGADVGGGLLQRAKCRWLLGVRNVARAIVDRQFPHRLQPRRADCIRGDDGRHSVPRPHRARLPILHRKFLRAGRLPEILPQPNVSHRHSLPRAIVRDALPAAPLRRASRPCREGARLDHPAHAGQARVFLLSTEKRHQLQNSLHEMEQCFHV